MVNDLSRLVAAAAPGAAPEAQLQALARLSPGRALEWLAARSDEEFRAISPPALRDALALVFDAFRPDAEPAHWDALAQVLGGAGACTPGAALGRMAERLPAEPPRPAVETAVAAALERTPGEAALIRAAATLAIRGGHGPDAHTLLTRLGTVDDSQGTLAWIRKQRRSLPPEGGQPVRIALLSSYTIDPLVPYLDLELRRLGLEAEIYVAPFNTWMRETLDPASGLRGFAPDMAFLSVGLDDLVPELAGAPDADALARAGEGALARVIEAAGRYAEWAHKPLVVHGFHSAFAGPLGVLEGRAGPSRGQWITELTARLGAALRDLPQCYLLDVAALLAQHRGGPDNPKLRLLASMRLPPEALGEVARAYARYVAPQMGLTRKCVVVDLDNTLWGGVVGEDGPQGIRLGSTAPGSEFVEFQRFLATLPQRGILLAVASKNNPDDALEVIRGHEAMVLRETAFSALRINWRPKPENLTSIAEELNIGLDSLVYVDDNPDEREQMRQLLPQVLTVELPRDPALYRSTLERLPALQVLAITEEDRLRAGQYLAKREREQIRVQAATVEDYLRSLGIRVAIGPVAEPDVSRVAQLFQRTNQFNVTTRRHDAGAVRRMLGDSAWRSWTLRASDRFGDHGLVATALARADGTEWTLDSFLMSCRVIGYGIETALLSDIMAAAAAAGATRLCGEFIPTRKNVPARDLFARHGFLLADTRSDGGELWTYEFTAGPLTFPPWIQRIT